MAAMTVMPLARRGETTKTLTQVVRLLVNGLMEDAYAEVEVAGERVTAAQFEVLRYIDRHCLPTVKQLAEALHISSAAATKSIAGLSEGRAVPLVQKARGRDRREVRLMTTPAGRRLVEGLQEAYAAKLEAVMAQMPPDDREGLDRGLRAFLLAALTSPDQCDAACLRCGVDHADDCLVHMVELGFGGGRVTAGEHGA